MPRAHSLADGKSTDDPIAVEVLILVAVLATSVLSGVLGMAGGMVFMAVLVTILPVATAMVVHGTAQAASNGARFLFLRRYVMWRVVPPYLLGGAIATALFALVRLAPHPGLVLILVGTGPWLARLMPGKDGLDIRNRGVGVACGATVTAAQLLAGASGRCSTPSTSIPRWTVAASSPPRRLRKRSATP